METRGVRGGIDRQESDLIYFRSEYVKLRVAAERESATIAGRVLNTERLVPKKEALAAKAMPKVNTSPTATVESEQGE